MGVNITSGTYTITATQTDTGDIVTSSGTIVVDFGGALDRPRHQCVGRRDRFRRR